MEAGSQTTCHVTAGYASSKGRMMILIDQMFTKILYPRGPQRCFKHSDSHPNNENVCR